MDYRISTRGPHTVQALPAAVGFRLAASPRSRTHRKRIESSALPAAFRDALAVVLLPGNVGLATRAETVARAQGDAAVVGGRGRTGGTRAWHDIGRPLRRLGDDRRRLRPGQDPARCAGPRARPDRSRKGPADPGWLGCRVHLPRRPAGSGRGRRVLGDAAPDSRRVAVRRRVGARRGGHRGVLGVGAGLHRHGDRGHHPQRNSSRRAAGPRRRTDCDGQGQTRGPARTQRRRPVDPAARADGGARVAAGRAAASSNAPQGCCAALGFGAAATRSPPPAA